MELIDGIAVLLRDGWRFLVNTPVPGVGFSFAALFVGIAVVNFGLSLLGFVSGASFGGISLLGYFTSGDAVSSAEYRRTRNSKVRISTDRMGDEV